MERLADQTRTKSKYNLESIGESKGFWVKEENKIININFVSEQKSFGELTIFELGPNGSIEKISRASSAGIDDYNQWILSNLSESIFNNSGIESSYSRYKIDKTKLDRDLVSLSVVKSEDLNIIELFRYIEYLESNTLDAGSYKASFHSRLASLLAIPVMCLFALPLSFGFQRSRGVGYRISIGIAIGLAYFIFQNVLMESVQVYSISPILIGWLPLLVLTSITSISYQLTRN
jgi:lipopolysaccharide export system permease protein